MASDESWAQVARDTRDALANLHHPIGPRCLPDEPEACGGTFAQHAMAHMATIAAIVNHQMEHLGHEWGPAFLEIYTHERETLRHP